MNDTATDGGANATDGNTTAPPDNVTDDGTSTVTATVEDVSAGDTVSVGLTTPATREDTVGVEAIETTVKTDDEFTLSVTTADTRLDGSPEFDAAGAEAVARVRVDHSIPNAEIGETTITFRLDKARLRESGIDPGDVALYRHRNGSWNELPTRQVGEAGTHLVFEAESPGLSEFAVGAKEPEFRIVRATVEASQVLAGETVETSVRVANVGGTDGQFAVELSIRGEVVDRRRVTIAANGTRQITFESALARPGRYAIAVNDVHAGDVVVESVGPNVTVSTGTGSPPQETATRVETATTGPQGTPATSLLTRTTETVLTATAESNLQMGAILGPLVGLMFLFRRRRP